MPTVADRAPLTAHRYRFKVEFKYSGRSWILWKHYTDFDNFSGHMQRSKRLKELADGLPKKHGTFGFLRKKVCPAACVYWCSYGLIRLFSLIFYSSTHHSAP